MIQGFSGRISWLASVPFKFKMQRFTLGVEEEGGEGEGLAVEQNVEASVHGRQLRRLLAVSQPGENAKVEASASRGEHLRGLPSEVGGEAGVDFELGERKGEALALAGDARAQDERGHGHLRHCWARPDMCGRGDGRSLSSRLDDGSPGRRRGDRAVGSNGGHTRSGGHSSSRGRSRHGGSNESEGKDCNEGLGNEHGELGRL